MQYRRRLLSFIIICMLVSSSIGLIPSARADVTKTVTLNPIQDSYVATAEHTNDNYGRSKYLEVTRRCESYRENTYVMFDLSNISRDAMIISATLKLYALYCKGVAKLWVRVIKVSLNVGAYYCFNNSWTEDGITWNNRPLYVENVTDKVTVCKEGEWYHWNVTNDTKKSLSGGKLTEVLISEDAKDSVYTHIWFASKDYGRYIPELKISYMIRGISGIEHIIVGTIIIVSFVITGTIFGLARTRNKLLKLLKNLQKRNLTLHL